MSIDCGVSDIRGIAKSIDEGNTVAGKLDPRDHRTTSDDPSSISSVKAVSTVFKLTVLYD